MPFKLNPARVLRALLTPEILTAACRRNWPTINAVESIEDIEMGRVNVLVFATLTGGGELRVFVYARPDGTLGVNL